MVLPGTAGDLGGESETTQDPWGAGQLAETQPTQWADAWWAWGWKETT